MIDDETEVTQLLRDMEALFPISVRPARELVETLIRSGTKCHPDENLQIESVLYLGDVGGIACGLKAWPSAGTNAVVVSLTHLRVDSSHPLAARIRAYQAKRTVKIAQSDDGPG
ncbi:MAG: hypothetical protein ABSG53_32580, partial [Thermoguttaceae bacterium]